MLHKNVLCFEWLKNAVFVIRPGDFDQNICLLN